MPESTPSTSSSTNGAGFRTHGSSPGREPRLSTFQTDLALLNSAREFFPGTAEFDAVILCPVVHRVLSGALFEGSGTFDPHLASRRSTAAASNAPMTESISFTPLWRFGVVERVRNADALDSAEFPSGLPQKARSSQSDLGPTRLRIPPSGTNRRRTVSF
jgi:hypothetical protein